MKFGLPFNLRGAEAAAWDVPGLRDAHFQEATKAVARGLQRASADVLCLVEVRDDGDVAELQGALHPLRLGYPHRTVGVSTNFVTRQNVAALSMFPLSEVVSPIPGRESYLAEPDDPETEEDTGLSKGMRVTVQAHDRAFLLYVVHLASANVPSFPCAPLAAVGW